jgi:hypothetical protein
MVKDCEIDPTILTPSVRDADLVVILLVVKRQVILVSEAHTVDSQEVSPRRACAEPLVASSLRDAGKCKWKPDNPDR